MLTVAAQNTAQDTEENSVAVVDVIKARASTTPVSVKDLEETRQKLRKVKWLHPFLRKEVTAGNSLIETQRDHILGESRHRIGEELYLTGND